ncbi:MAG: hypothetical protein U0002_16120 [Thermoanaerobaculia bacterium]
MFRTKALWLLAVLAVVSLGASAWAEGTSAPQAICQDAPTSSIQSAPAAVPEPDFLAGIAEVCYDGFNGCDGVTPHTGNCCWRCPGGPITWSCTNVSSTSACKSKCTTTCGTTCGWI